MSDQSLGIWNPVNTPGFSFHGFVKIELLFE